MLSGDPVCTGAVWSELWRSKLGSRREYQKVWLNLGPIISAPAAKGNISTSPHNSHHVWGFGVWRHTQGILLLNSDRVSRSFVPFSDKARFVCNMQVLPLVMLASLMFMQNRLTVWLQTFHWQNITSAWTAHIVQNTIILNGLANTKSLLDFKMDLLRWV